MLVDKNSSLFKKLTEELSDDKVIPYINKWLEESPNAGVYEIRDLPYVSRTKNAKDRHFYPSGDCMKCQRLMYWERMEPKKLIEERTPASTQMIFKIGTMFHEMLQAWFKSWNELKGYPRCADNERPIIDEEWNIGGYIDSVLVFPGNDDEIPIEIKTINSNRFATLKAPLPAHKLQVGCYIMHLDAPFGIVLYVNKDTGEMKEYKVEPFDMQPTLMRWADVRMAVANEDISSLTYGCQRGSKDWERCPARNLCFRV